ncbi:GTPase Era [Synechococcus sp. PCC 7336]|uniref:GTPase Era n=1 Tax=Synechococcus sp. PCC 7336 TaxID=195250 RepID=UPI0003472C8A|nr:GTPase Era [Synechococcus sp. PCC 7336]
MTNPNATPLRSGSEANLSDSIPGLLPQAPAGFRSGFVALVGRPNVGKSTLLNGLVGQKIAITSSIAQTTRNRLQGILTLPKAQVILVDTPGIHKPHHRLGKTLVQTARAALNSVDVAVLVVDGSVPAGKGDRFIVNWLAPNVPAMLCRNKQDLLPTDSQQRQTIAQSYRELLPQAPQVSVSALDEATLTPLLDRITQLLPEGPYYYPPDLVTDQPERFIMGELIREQVLLHTRNEVPHSVAIAIDRVEEAPKITRILATVVVERDSQKGILIGKQGQMLKAIGSGARQQIQKLIVGKVYLELFVKVRPRWRQSAGLLAELGYRGEG